MAIKDKIYRIRGIQVMLDSDLAELYHVGTKQLNRLVKRNLERFPQTFMFQLTESEYNSLRCQNGTLNKESLRSQFVTLSLETPKGQILRCQNGTVLSRNYFLRLSLFQV